MATCGAHAQPRAGNTLDTVGRHAQTDSILLSQSEDPVARQRGHRKRTVGKGIGLEEVALVWAHGRAEPRDAGSAVEPPAAIISPSRRRSMSSTLPASKRVTSRLLPSRVICSSRGKPSAGKRPGLACSWFASTTDRDDCCCLKEPLWRCCDGPPLSPFKARCSPPSQPWISRRPCPDQKDLDQAFFRRAFNAKPIAPNVINQALAGSGTAPTLSTPER